MEVDWQSDTWADAEEETWGPHDTEENRENYPDGFVWTCCELSGSEQGCKVGPHRTEPSYSDTETETETDTESDTDITDTE